jgi:4-amino-4-deoxy-L-arabinose transferase-like glycosyltransferase
LYTSVTSDSQPPGLGRRSASSASDGSYVLCLIVCLGALLAFRLAALHASAVDFVMDEAQYWTWSQDLDFGYFSKPPLIAWVIRGMTEVCGQSVFCVRSASPILHTLTALMLFVTGRALYDARIGFWSAIVFATLPGVSYSSMLMTTDVPLVFVWSVMLFFWVMLVKRQSMGFTILFGIAVGIGLLAKQAMIYAALCVACHAVVSREAREALRGGRGIVAAVIALALFSPNIIWNAQNDFPTLKHTGTNIGWQYPYVHPLRVLEYIGVQLGVFGPILFIVLARGAWREIREPRDKNKILLLSFSLPVLTLLVVQAFLSRAHGNWSATAYPAATIFVTAVMLELNRTILFRVSLALHLAFAAIIGTAPAFARQWPVFEQLQFLRTSLGWRDVAGVVRTRLEEGRYGALLVHTRVMAAELLYYLRDSKVPLYVWAPGPSPHDHYEMTRPFTADVPEPILFVSLKRCPTSITGSFADFKDLGVERVPLVRDWARNVHFCRLAGYKDKASAAP